jgi:hypothetical protein
MSAIKASSQESAASSESAKTWGPHYWFFMMSVALSYPDFPNETTKRKYYDFFTNFALFIPDPDMGKRFSGMLDRYPITPYLGSKDSLVRWVVFIHNKYNEMLGKHEVSLDAALAAYYDQFIPKPVYLHHKLKMRRYWIHAVFIALCFALIFWLA